MKNFSPETMVTARALRTILPNYAKPNNRLFLLDTSGPRAYGQAYSLVEQEWAEIGVQCDMEPFWDWRTVRTIARSFDAWQPDVINNIGQPGAYSVVFSKADLTGVL